MKAMWSGTISIGLVHIPVKLYPGSRSRGINLDYLRKEDHCPVGYTYICKETGERVEYEDIVRGYQLESGEYVEVTDEDFEKANVEASNSIRVLRFVDEEEIGKKYFVKPYYLSPDKEADALYGLFRTALAQEGKVGIVKYVLRNKEHLGALSVEGDMFVLEQMRFEHEIRDPSQVPVPVRQQVPQEELELASQLVEKMSGRFRPEAYHDTYTEDLKEIIAEKAAGKEVVEPKGQMPEPTEMSTLASQLKESLRETERRRGYAP